MPTPAPTPPHKYTPRQENAMHRRGHSHRKSFGLLSKSTEKYHIIITYNKRQCTIQPEEKRNQLWANYSTPTPHVMAGRGKNTFVQEEVNIFANNAVILAQAAAKNAGVCLLIRHKRRPRSLLCTSKGKHSDYCFFFLFFSQKPRKGAITPEQARQADHTRGPIQFTPLLNRMLFGLVQAPWTLCLTVFFLFVLTYRSELL